MTDPKVESQEQRQANLAPETHNDEQDDHRSQAQEVAEQARSTTTETVSPTESVKPDNAADILGNQGKDLIDEMRDMESSGRIDMGAFAGEPNHDDNVDKYGKPRKPGDVPSPDEIPGAVK